MINQDPITPLQFFEKKAQRTHSKKESEMVNILGVSPENSENILESILKLNEQNSVAKKTEDPTEQSLVIPTQSSRWVQGLLHQNSQENISYFLASPPADLEAFLKSMEKHDRRNIFDRRNEQIWRGLENLVPDWLSGASEIEIIKDTNNIEFLAYIGRQHPNFFKEELGIIPSITNPERWMIDPSPRRPETLLCIPEFEDSPWKILLEKIWKRRKSEARGIQITSGAEQLIDQMDLPNVEFVAWLWGHVEELRSYLMGDETGWINAASLAECSLDENGTALGSDYLRHAARAIVKKSALADSDPNLFLDIARGWLGVPLLSDQENFHRLVGNSNTGDEIPGFSGPNQLAAVTLLTRDEGCRNGYLSMLQSPDTDVLSDKHTDQAKKIMGCLDEDFPAKLDRSKTGGLVEMAALIGKGPILNNLLDHPDGIKAIQEVFNGPNGFHCLLQIGENSGWQRFSKKVVEHPDSWADWRDRHGNTITHWIIFGQNKLENNVSWQANHRLLKVLPEQFTVSNEQGAEPTNFMIREHANRIAAKLIQENGTLTRIEKRAKSARKPRKI